MKHLKGFKIFEELYSCPNSVYELSKEVIDLIADETLKWKDGSREEFKDYIFYKVKNHTSDFPVDRVKMKLTITSTDKFGDFNCAGKSHYKNTGDPLLVPMIKKIWDEGKIDIGIEIDLMMSERADPTRDEIIEIIEKLVIHELFHSYQFYKRDLKTGKDSPNKFIHDLSVMVSDFYEEFYHITFLADIINLTYIHLEIDETSAHLAELHAKNDETWVEFYNEFKKMTFEEILNLSRLELKKHKVSEKKVINKFLKMSGEIGADMSEVETFEDLIKWFYNIIKANQGYVTRKLGKILFSKR